MRTHSDTRRGGRRGRPGRRFGWSLRPKLLLAFLVVALIPIVALTVYEYYAITAEIDAAEAAETSRVATTQAKQMADEIERLHQLGYQLAAAQGTRLRGADNAQREDFITNLLFAMPSVSRILLLELDGTVQVAVPRMAANFRPEVLDAPKRGQSAAVIGENEAKLPQYQIFMPLTERGQTQRILMITAEFRSMMHVSVLPRADEGSFLTIVDREGKVLFSSKRGWETDFKEMTLQWPELEAARQGTTTTGWVQMPGQGDMYVAAAPIEGTQWVVVFTVPSEAIRHEMQARIYEQVRVVAVAVSLLLMLVLVVAMVISRQLLGPIQAIGQVMSEVRAGRYTARVRRLGGDELGTLGDDLNQTLDEVVSLVQTREERDALQAAIRTLLDEVSEVAQGNLAIQAEVTAGPTGAIADSFNYMIDELRGLVQRTQATTDQVSTEATGVLLLTEQLVASATEQRRRLEEARASVTQMTQMMTEVRQSVDDSVTATSDARRAVETGQQAVLETVGAIGRLRTETREMASKIKRLGESSQEIGQITRLIDEIADQTHLLALNASIQAAMAGEHGRGFAVVAEEVRALAERSAAATGKIEDLVRVIQDDANTAMVAMERSTQEVVAGSRLADRAGGALTVIGNVTDRIVSLSEQIERLVVTQFTAAEALEKTVVDVVSATNKATEDVRVVAEEMQTLVNLSTELRESVSVFTVETVDDAGAMEVAA